MKCEFFLFPFENALNIFRDFRICTSLNFVVMSQVNEENFSSFVGTDSVVQLNFNSGEAVTEG